MNKLVLKFKKAFNRVNFSTKDYWELRYQGGGNSGEGSYGAFCEGKAKILNDLIAKYNIQQITELGCGDGNQLKYYNIPEYLGLDVSATAINNCVEIFKDDPNKSFLHLVTLIYSKWHKFRQHHKQRQ